MQVNATSVKRFRYKRFIKMLVEIDCMHFIASDAHNLSERSVEFDEGIRYLTKKYGKGYVDWLLYENPTKVLNGQYI